MKKAEPETTMTTGFQSIRTSRKARLAGTRNRRK